MMTGMHEVRFDFAPSGQHRRRLVVGALGCWVVAAMLLVLVIEGQGGADSWPGRLAFLLLAIALILLGAYLVRGARAPAGWLTIGGEQVVLAHPELLREPIVLARTDLRTVLVDDGPTTSEAWTGPPELVPRFELVETSGDPGWLHPGGRSALPMLGWQREAPNAALVLRHAHELGDGPRRLLALFSGNEELRALQTCAGFFLVLANPAAASDALREAGLDPPLTLAEAERLDDLAVDRRWTLRH
jgi:hypothetical protein